MGGVDCFYCDRSSGMIFAAEQFCIDHGIEYWLEGNNVSPGWCNIRCPLCGDHSNHGGINPHGPYYHCWRCGGHSLAYIIGTLLRKPRMSAERLIEEYEGITTPQLKRPGKSHSQFSLPGGALKKVHREYIRSRGFNPDKLERKYKLRGTTFKGDYRYRIIIPIIQEGKAVSFQARDYTGKHPRRYLSCPPVESVVHYKDAIYGIDFARGDTVGVVEGPIDQWRMGDGFVATYGTSMTPAQIRLLSRFRRVVFCFDPEPQAQERARKSAVQLSSLGTQVELVDLELGKRDPGDLSPAEAKEIRKELGFGRD